MVRKDAIPKIKSLSSVQGITNVIPSKTISKMGAKRWKEMAESDQFRFVVYKTEEMSVAEEIVKGIIEYRLQLSH